MKHKGRNVLNKQDFLSSKKAKKFLKDNPTSKPRLSKSFKITTDIRKTVRRFPKGHAVNKVNLKRAGDINKFGKWAVRGGATFSALAAASAAWDLAENPNGPASRTIDNFNSYANSLSVLDAHNLANGLLDEFGVAETYLGYLTGFAGTRHLMENPPPRPIPNPFK